MKAPELFSKVFPGKNKYALKFFFLAFAVILLPIVMLLVFVASTTGISPAMRMGGIAAVVLSLALLIVIYNRFIKYTNSKVFNNR